MVKDFDLADAADLYTLRNRAGELANLVTNAERDLRLGEKRATSILDAIDLTRSLTISEFLGSLGIESLGKRRVELMINAADGDLNMLKDWRSGKLRDTEFAVRVGVPNISGQIQDGIDSMSQVINKLIDAGVTAEPAMKNSHESYTKLLKTACISGKLSSGKKKNDYAAPLHSVGIKLVDEVFEGLTYLVLADPTSSSSKAKKAGKLGIEIISEIQLQKMISKEK